MTRWAIDWDATCVEGKWPEMGNWLPGAVEALRELVKHGEVVIHSCRVAPYEFQAEQVRRDPAKVAEEINGIRRMLDAEGLHEVVIWTRDYKPPAVSYVDDRARRYNGRTNAWKKLVPVLLTDAGLFSEAYGFVYDTYRDPGDGGNITAEP